jgi:hypothetical protein
MGHPAAENPTATLEHLAAFSFRDRIDQDRTLAGSEYVAAVNSIVGHQGQLLQFGRPEVSAAEARCLAAVQRADFKIESITFLDSRPQDTANHDERGIRRSQQGIGGFHALPLHFVHHDRPLRGRFRIATGSFQSADKSDGFDDDGMETEGHGQIADQAGGRPGRFVCVGTLGTY